MKNGEGSKWNEPLEERKRKEKKLRMEREVVNK